MEGPTVEDFEQAEQELHPVAPVGTVWSDPQRAAISRRAYAIFLDRQKAQRGVN